MGLGIGGEMGQGKCVPCHGEGKHDCFGMEKTEGANFSPSSLSGSKINIIHSPAKPKLCPTLPSLPKR